MIFSVTIDNRRKGNIEYLMCLSFNAIYAFNTQVKIKFKF